MNRGPHALVEPLENPGARAAAPRLVLFVLDGQRYALPLESVERAVPMVAIAPLPKAPAIALGVINLHGRIVPVVDLRRRFGRPPCEYGVTAHLLVVRAARRTLALPVDEVLGVSDVVAVAVMPPEGVLPGIAHLRGIAALPDGLLFIQDLDACLSLDEEARLGQALAEAER